MTWLPPEEADDTEYTLCEINVLQTPVHLGDKMFRVCMTDLETGQSLLVIGPGKDLCDMALSMNTPEGYLETAWVMVPDYAIQEAQ